MSNSESESAAPGRAMRPEGVMVRHASAFAEAAAAWIVDAIAAVLARRDRCSVALTGGNTPRAIYQRLADRHVDVPWGLLDIYFGDERRVPPDDPESNYRMAVETLLGSVPVEPARVHRMQGELEDGALAALEYERELPPALDILLLGVGADGHTASLFPGAPQLRERERHVVVSVSPLPPTGRLTITPPVIAAARRVAVIAAGGSKAQAVARALEGSFDPYTLPAQFALRGSWLLDDAAASLLRVVPA